MRSNFHGYTEVNCFHNHYILIQNKIIIIENMFFFFFFFFFLVSQRKFQGTFIVSDCLILVKLFV